MWNTPHEAGETPGLTTCKGTNGLILGSCWYCVTAADLDLPKEIPSSGGGIEHNFASDKNPKEILF